MKHLEKDLKNYKEWIKLIILKYKLCKNFIMEI